ncbi:MAG TPA: hypothetical protein VGD01_07325 [Candidatus Elarobacter sp.]
MQDRQTEPLARVLVRIEAIEDLGGFGAGEGTVGAGAVATVRGWAVDPSSREPVGVLRVAIGDGPAVRAISGFARDDIARRLASESARTCGFVAAVPVDAALGVQPVRVEAQLGGEWVRVRDAGSVEVVPQSDPFDALSERGHGWLFGVDGVELDDGATAPREDGVWILRPGTLSRVRLWALDLIAEAPPAKVVALAGGTFFDALAGFETPAVAALTGWPGAERAGFALAVMAPFVGGETLKLFAISAGGESYGELGTLRTRLPAPLPVDAVPSLGNALGALDRVAVDGVAADHAVPVHLERGALLSIQGWAVDRRGPRLAACVELEIPGAGRFEADYGFRRQDVAWALRSGVAACGFALTVDSARIEPGTYRAALRVLGARRDAFTVLPDVDLVVH